MKKNKSNLLIPAVVIVVLILILGFVLMKENILDFFKPYPYAMTRIEGFPTVVVSAKKIEKQRAIINSQEEYDNLMNNILDDVTKVKTPSVDFSKNRLLVVTTSTNETKGHAIKVKSILKNTEENRLDAVILLSKPGETCQNPEESNIAIDMVILEKNNGDVSFDKEEKTVECK
jgi:hypothetical protein